MFHRLVVRWSDANSLAGRGETGKRRGEIAEQLQGISMFRGHHQMLLEQGAQTARWPPAGLSRWGRRSVSYGHEPLSLVLPRSASHPPAALAPRAGGRRSGKRNEWLSSSRPTTFTSGTRPLGSSSNPCFSELHRRQMRPQKGRNDLRHVLHGPVGAIRTMLQCTHKPTCRRGYLGGPADHAGGP